MSRPAYPTDLSDAEWALLEPPIPAPLPGGRPPRHARREIVHAIMYVLRTGCQWRAAPHDLPPWGTVWWDFRTWREAGFKRRFGAWVEAELGWRVAVVQHPDAGKRVVWVAPGQDPPLRLAGFRVLPRRWVVARTFAWLGRNRRLSKDDEALSASEEAWLYAASCRLLPRRLVAQ